MAVLAARDSACSSTAWRAARRSRAARSATSSCTMALLAIGSGSSLRRSPRISGLRPKSTWKGASRCCAPW
eukprot:2552026-Alexandrium_andersonii.AAC.1